jgi:hypothetical protein
MTPLRTFASASAASIYDAINAANSPDDLALLIHPKWQLCATCGRILREGRGASIASGG